LKRAAGLSISLNHHLFDTLYHAVALEEGATLVTADETYFAKAGYLGGMMLLAKFSA
jgi:predicted nucleic acid-binding protein